MLRLFGAWRWVCSSKFVLVCDETVLQAEVRRYDSASWNLEVCSRRARGEEGEKQFEREYYISNGFGRVRGEVLGGTEVVCRPCRRLVPSRCQSSVIGPVSRADIIFILPPADALLSKRQTRPV